MLTNVRETLHDFYILVCTWQDMLQTGMIVGGWDKYEGGKIYGIPLGGTVIEQPFAIGGMLLCFLLV